MSEPVEVLAVMDARINSLECDGAYRAAYELRDARTAVAELIEAAHSMATVDLKVKNNYGRENQIRLRAALANIRNASCSPIEQYEVQQRALETERAARINADLQRDVMSVPSSNNPYSNTTNTWPTLKHARYGQLRTMTDDELFEFNHPSRIKNSYNDKQPEAAPFCAPYGEKDAEPGALVWLGRVLFVVVLAAAFYTAARWVMP